MAWADQSLWACLVGVQFAAVTDADAPSCLQGPEGHYVLEFNNYTEGGKVGKPDKLEVSQYSSCSSGQARDAPRLVLLYWQPIPCSCCGVYSTSSFSGKETASKNTSHDVGVAHCQQA